MIRFINLDTGKLFHGLANGSTTNSYIHWFAGKQSTNISYVHKICIVSDDESLKFSIVDTKSTIFQFVNPEKLEEDDFSKCLQYEYTSTGVSSSGKYLHMLYIYACSPDEMEAIERIDVGSDYFYVGADFYGVREELKINLGNMGVDIPESIQKAFYDTNVYESEINAIELNRKYKELLLNFMEILGNRGSYKSLINSLNWFEYPSTIINLREFWMHEEWGRIIYSDSDFTQVLQKKTESLLRNFSKSTFLSITCALEEFETDADGNLVYDEVEQVPKLKYLYENYDTLGSPIYKWSREEMDIKMALLGRYYETYFMPVHMNLIHSCMEDRVYTSSAKLFGFGSTDRCDEVIHSGYIEHNINPNQVYALGNVNVFADKHTTFSSGYKAPTVVVGGTKIEFGKSTVYKIANDFEIGLRSISAKDTIFTDAVKDPILKFEETITHTTPSVLGYTLQIEESDKSTVESPVSLSITKGKVFVGSKEIVPTAGKISLPTKLKLNDDGMYSIVESKLTDLHIEGGKVYQKKDLIVGSGENSFVIHSDEPIEIIQAYNNSGNGYNNHLIIGVDNILDQSETWGDISANDKSAWTWTKSDKPEPYKKEMLKNFLLNYYNGVGVIVPIHLTVHGAINDDSIIRETIAIKNDKTGEWDMRETADLITSEIEKVPVYDPNTEDVKYESSGRYLYNIDFNLLCTRDYDYDLRLCLYSLQGQVYSTSIKFSVVDTDSVGISVYKVVPDSILNPTPAARTRTETNRYTFSHYIRPTDIPKEKAFYTQYIPFDNRNVPITLGQPVLTATSSGIHLYHMVVFDKASYAKIDSDVQTYFTTNYNSYDNVLSVPDSASNTKYKVFVAKYHGLSQMEKAMPMISKAVAKAGADVIVKNEMMYDPSRHKLVRIEPDRIDPNNPKHIPSLSQIKVDKHTTLCLVPSIRYSRYIESHEWELINVSTGKVYKLPSIQEPFVGSNDPQMPALQSGYYDVVFRYKLSSETDIIRESRLNGAFILDSERTGTALKYQLTNQLGWKRPQGLVPWDRQIAVPELDPKINILTEIVPVRETNFRNETFSQEMTYQPKVLTGVKPTEPSIPDVPAKLQGQLIPISNFSKLPSVLKSLV